MQVRQVVAGRDVVPGPHAAVLHDPPVNPAAPGAPVPWPPPAQHHHGGRAVHGRHRAYPPTTAPAGARPPGAQGAQGPPAVHRGGGQGAAGRHRGRRGVLS